MKKIMLAMDPETWSRNAVDTACYLSKLSGSVLSAAFMHLQNDKASSNNFDPSPGRAMADTVAEPMFIKRLKDACDSRETRYAVPESKAVSVEKIIEESLFSDLLVIDPAITLNAHIEPAPSSLARHILRHAHCPVILAEGLLQDTTELIFTYDGNSSACRAIKQFTYLFPEFANRRVTILEIENSKTTDVPAKVKMLEWTNAHYNYLAYITLEGKPSVSLSTYLLSHPNALVVMGAYGRSLVSRLLKPSSSNSVTGTVSNPFFITHH
jgi:hypothetical protein